MADFETKRKNSTSLSIDDVFEESTWLSDKYNKHLDKIFKKNAIDEEYKNIFKQFYTDFRNKFADIYYYRETLPTVKVNGKILEQDNVKKLFKKGRQCVSAVEIFVELFCGNVKTIKFIEDYKLGDDTLGFYDAIDGCIALGKVSPEEMYYYVSEGKFLSKLNLSEKSYREKLTNIKNSVEKHGGFDEEIKKLIVKQMYETIYHELCHVWGSRKVGKKYVLNAYTKSFIKSKNHIFIQTGYDKFEKIKENEEIDNFVKSLSYKGAKELGEIVNEVLSKEILTEQEVFAEYNPPPENTDENHKKYSARMSLDGSCAYNCNYYLMDYMECLNYFNWFTSETFRDNMYQTGSDFSYIKSIEINNEILRTCQETLADMIKIKYFPNSDKIKKDLLSALSKIGTFNTLMIACSFTSSEGDGKSKDEGRSEYKFDYTDKGILVCQTILIQAIKEKITREFDIRTTERKDFKLFEQIDDVLGVIKDHLLCPNGWYSNIRYPKGPQPDYDPPNFDTTEPYIHESKIYTINMLSEKYPEEKHIQIFNDLIRIVDFNARKHPDFQRMVQEGCFSFLRREAQIKRDFNYMQWLNGELEGNKTEKIDENLLEEHQEAEHNSLISPKDNGGIEETEPNYDDVFKRMFEEDESYRNWLIEQEQREASENYAQDEAVNGELKNSAVKLEDSQDAANADKADNKLDRGEGSDPIIDDGENSDNEETYDLFKLLLDE